jgi:hypothetical protein
MGDAQERGQALFEILEVPLLDESAAAADIGKDSLEFRFLRRE